MEKSMELRLGAAAPVNECGIARHPGLRIERRAIIIQSWRDWKKFRAFKANISADPPCLRLASDQDEAQPRSTQDALFMHEHQSLPPWLPRRTFMKRAAGVAALAGGIKMSLFGSTSAAAEKTFPVQKPDAEWRRILTPAQYDVLRGHGTEWAGSSPLDKEKRRGIFACAGCAAPLFDSETKFDSGTGWPSFFAPIPGAVATSVDRKFLLMVRTEVHCARCGGHLGHVFEDGPRPTGLRYCMNGVAMTFNPAEGA